MKLKRHGLLWSVMTAAGMWGAIAGAVPGSDSDRTAPLSIRIEKALQQDSDWLFFRNHNQVSRLKYFGTNRYYYPTEDDQFKLVTVNGKIFAGRRGGGIFEPHWENQTRFTANFIPDTRLRTQLNRQTNDVVRELQQWRMRERDQQSRLETLRRRQRNLAEQLQGLNRRKNLEQLQEQNGRKSLEQLQGMKRRISLEQFQKQNRRKSREQFQGQITGLTVMLENVKNELTALEREHRDVQAKVKILAREAEEIRDRRDNLPSGSPP
ncbi:MAG: hypothetical protein PHQ27_08050 [Victivallales bacterium]|nr:hypothetical protein [Victivallales bacterium]